MIRCRATLVFLAILMALASTALAGIAGKDPTCVGACGRELASCLSGCRPNTACFDECKSISALLVNEILECQNRCADEIQTCEDLCKTYNDDCLEQCN